VFHDHQLQDLIRTALKQNYDLQLAVERVNAARAQIGITRSNEFPQVSLDRLSVAERLIRTSSLTFSRSLQTPCLRWTYSGDIDARPKRQGLNCWAQRTHKRP
jgi:outer membrane protein TolC